jgi:hypothetical protein
MEVGGIASCILNLCTRWRQVVSFTFQMLHPWETTPGTHSRGSRMDIKAGLNVVTMRKISAHTRNQTLIVQLVAKHNTT